MVEIPTYIKDGKEKPRLSIRIMQSVLGLFGQDNHADLYTLIGDPSDGTYHGKPAIDIANGVSVESIKVRQPIPHEGFNMVAVASVAYWHGFDRTVRGLIPYKDRTDIQLNIIGPDGYGSLAECMKIAEKEGLTHMVHALGSKYGDELGKLLDSSDIAFASLALFRKK